MRERQRSQGVHEHAGVLNADPLSIPQQVAMATRSLVFRVVVVVVVVVGVGGSESGIQESQVI